MANSKIVNTPSQAVPQSGTAHTQVTVTGTAANIVSSLNANTSHVLMQFNGAIARVTFDGSNPTAAKGFIYPDGSTAYLTRQMALAAKAIRTDVTNVIVEVQELNFL